MTDLENLTQLIYDNPEEYISEGTCRNIADHLLANGVTFQKWIPVTERLPEDFVSVIIYVPSESPLPMVKEAYRANEFWATKMQIFSDEEVTHWMPLPEPPKEA